MTKIEKNVKIVWKIAKCIERMHKFKISSVRRKRDLNSTLMEYEN